MQSIKSKSKKYFSGFSLVELLIAMTIISISFFPLMNLFMTSLQNVQTTTEKATAINLAREGMERLRNKNMPVQVLELTPKEYFPSLDSPPIELNKIKWRILTEFVPGTRPLITHIKIINADENITVYKISTLTEDTY